MDSMEIDLKRELVIRVSSSNFKEEVIKSNLPVVLDFYAGWCGPCRMVSPAMEHLSREYEGRVKFVKIDTDENSDVANSFNILALPTILLLESGKIKDTIVGANPVELYRQHIDKIFRIQASD
jgi:thioredoxin 1